MGVVVLDWIFPQLVETQWVVRPSQPTATAAVIAVGATSARGLSFDDTLTALGVDNVQDAIVALYALIGATPPAPAPVLLSGALSASSALAGALSVTRALSGQVSGSGAFTAALTVEREGLSGSVIAAGLLTGSLEVTRALMGAVDGSAAVGGALEVTRALAGSVAASGQLTGDLTVEESAVERVIWDTDIDSDCDDVAATALMGQYLEESGAHLIAAVTASNNEYAAPALKAMLSYMGFGSVPVGAYKGTAIGGGDVSLYTLGVRNAFRPGETRADYPDALTALVTALTAAPDQSVTYIIGGTCTNLAALLAAQPALCAAKIKLVSVMGGWFPSVQQQENNIFYDVAAANAVASSGLTLVWAGADAAGGVMTRIPADADANHDPFKLAWDLSTSQQTNGRRNSWDLAAVSYGVLGLNDIFSLSAAGNLSFSAEGFTNFSTNPAGKNRYLLRTKTNEQIAEIWDADIEAILDSRDTFPPVITSSASPSITEGETLNLTITGSEALGSASIIGGADAASFSIAGLVLTLPTTVGQAGASRIVTVRVFDTNGNFTDQTITASITSAAGIAGDMLFRYLLNEGSGATVTDSGSGARNGSLINTHDYWVDAANNPAGSPKVGVSFVGALSGRLLLVDSTSAVQTPSLHAFIACDIRTIATPTGLLMAKDNLGSGQRSWLFNTTNAGGALISFTGRGATPRSITAPITAGSGWHIYEVEVNGLAVVIRRDGTQIGTGTLANAIANSTANLTIGNRQSGANPDTASADATVGDAVLYPRALTSGEAAAVRNDIKSKMALKGITLP